MRCDAETNNGACNAVAHWEIQTRFHVLYYCNRHKRTRREPEHFIRAPLAQWRRIEPDK